VIGKAANALGMDYDGTHTTTISSIGAINNHLACGLPVMLNVDYKSHQATKEVDNPNYDSKKPENKVTNPKKITEKVYDAEGKPVWKDTYEYDHWILCVARNGDLYTCLDPSYGATVIMTSNKARMNEKNERAGQNTYSFGYPVLVGERGFSGRSPGDYTVRRIGLLGPASPI
jgi:hypothetical protein